MSSNPQRPNVIVIISHDTGRHISPYGIETVRTPNFERLATQSVRFSNAFTTAPQCSPARACLFSGRYPHAAGVMGNVGREHGWRFPDSERHAARIFGDAGYQTWLLGLWHETYLPETLGFDAIQATPSICDVPELFRQQMDARQADRPFYCQIGCHETHRPFTRFPIDTDAPNGVQVPGYLNDGPKTRQDLAEQQGSVERLDRGLGMLLDQMEHYGLMDNTILVVTTDHGIAFVHAKCTLYDGGLGALLFMRNPFDAWGEGVVRDDLVSHVDILPTLLDCCGIAIPENFQGHTLRASLQGTAPAVRDAVFGEKTFHSFYDPMRAVRTERYKYIRNFEFCRYADVSLDFLRTGSTEELGTRYDGGHPMEELYDLQEDPDELNNLAADPAHAETCAQLRQRLAAWMEETDDPLRKGPIASPFYDRGLRELQEEAKKSENQ